MTKLLLKLPQANARGISQYASPELKSLRLVQRSLGEVGSRRSSHSFPILRSGFSAKGDKNIIYPQNNPKLIIILLYEYLNLMKNIKKFYQKINQN